ncbi:MAG TPA: ASCH domain-containing protein [Bacillota bacterium]|nr:ASCH domain-containing protein [Bacillota bacterium]
MKALTLTQPWASLIAAGEKRIETRSWSTRHRGPLAIHAALGFPPAARRRCATEPTASALRRHGWADAASLPRGAIVATCRLVDVRPIASPADAPPGDHAAFGDFGPGRWAWVLEDIRPLVPPRPARGRLGLWEIDIQTRPSPLTPET